MSEDLRDKITTAIDRAERTAQRTESTDRWRYEPTPAGPRVITGPQTRDVWTRESNPGVWTCDDEQDGCMELAAEWQSEAEHIALNDPAAVLRRCAADRRVLERHKRVDWYEGGTGCWYCSGEDEPQHRPVDWPCDDIRDLADRYGIEAEA